MENILCIGIHPLFISGLKFLIQKKKEKVRQFVLELELLNLNDNFLVDLSKTKNLNFSIFMCIYM